MEALGTYLLKSAAWLSAFALVFIVFLRNERYFRWNRFFLLSGIIAAFFLPLITVSYTVPLPYAGGTPATAGTAEVLPEVPGPGFPDPRQIILILYLAGTAFVLASTVLQGRRLLKSIRKADIVPSDYPVRIIRSNEYKGAFSFFAYVFVNPSVTDTETKEIMHHELVHISQRHWIDLALAGMLCTIQWFNPLAWVYIRLVRQNHEYLADEAALQRTSDPAKYMAALMNQIVGAPVFDLVNSFSYSLNKKRFNMMKNIITSPYRKLRMLLIIPVSGVLLWSFAEPEYVYDVPNVDVNADRAIIAIPDQDVVVNGKVAQRNGSPLPGAIVVIQGTTKGTSCDPQGSFRLERVPAEGMLVVSHVGYKTKSVKASFAGTMTITMDPDTVKLESIGVPPPPPPPPPGTKNEPITVTGYATKQQGDGHITVTGNVPSEFNVRSMDGKKPLVIIDGKESNTDLSTLNAGDIASVSVWKGQAAVDKYGERARDGVIEVTTIESGGEKQGPPVYATVEKAANTGQETYVAVEEMPSFPGGMEAMKKWVYNHMQIQSGMDYKSVKEPIYVVFTVGKDGKVRDAKVRKSVSPLFDAEAVRVVSSLPDFKPGMQNGKPVDVRMQLPIDFSAKVPAK